MRYLFVVIGILTSIITSFGQTQTLPSAGLKFELPNDKWKQNGDEFKNPNVFNYERERITDKKGQQVMPTIAFIVETVPDSTDLVVYSAAKKGKVPFNVEEVFTSKDKKPKLKYEYAIGYKATYNDKRRGEQHTIYIIHLINKNKGVQIIMDITSELFPKYEEEFLKVMRSIRNL